MKRPFIIAHRGAPEYIRENTLASIALALRLGAGMVEIDVRRTKDGVLVVHHEDRIAGMSRPIEALTWPAVRPKIQEAGLPTPYRIPTLRKVLAVFGDKFPLAIEIKSPGAEKSLIRLLSRNRGKGHIVIAPYETFRKIRSLDPTLPVHLLIHPSPRQGFSNWVLGLLSLAHLRLGGASGLVVHRALARPGLIRRAHRKGLSVTVWTVDSAGEMQRFIRLGVDGIITNRPHLLLQVIMKMEKGENGHPEA
jgi:glycerophosphoryl diester phosphodiesterase